MTAAMTAAPPDQPHVRALLDGLSGSNAQTRGVVEALGLSYDACAIGYAREWPWQRLAGVVRPTAASRAAMLAAPEPALVVSTGRRAGAAARWLAEALVRRTGRRPRLLHVQDPRYGHAAFDRIIVMQHDRRRAVLERRDCVRVVTGAPHPLTRARVDAAAAPWQGAMADAPRPWIAVLVGGDSGRRRLDAAIARRLLAQARGLATAAGGGTLMVTTSRRTPPDALGVLRAELAAPHRLWPCTAEAAANPYPGLLGLADAVIVTGDSMSMLSEATVAGGPLFIFAPSGWARAPHARFHARLVADGIARPLTDAPTWQPWQHPPVNPAAAIADEARALLRADGWQV